MSLNDKHSPVRRALVLVQVRQTDSMLGPTLHDHLAQAKRVFLVLHRSGRSDESVWAVLGAELFFRSPGDRFLEYAAYSILRWVWPGRAMRLSVGVAQVQVRHWIDLGQLSQDSGLVNSLRKFLSLQANYDVAKSFLTDRLPIGKATPQALAAAYVGEARFYHMTILEKHLAAASEVGRMTFDTTPLREL